MATVMIDGVQYFSLKDLALLHPLTKPEAIAVIDGSESDLLSKSRKAISDSSWTVGKIAALWTKRFARGRSDADFGCLVGLSTDQIYQRRRVWEAFGDVYQNYPRLVWSHFYAALDWDDATECLQWAQDVQAGVSEMRAWRRAQHGE